MNDEGYSRCAAVLGSLLAAGGYSSTLAILAAWRAKKDLAQRRRGAKLGSEFI